MVDVAIGLAPQAADIAANLIRRFHPHLVEARIVWAFTTARRKKCDRVRLASAKKFSAMERFLSSGQKSVDAGYDFLGLIDVSQWNILPTASREALVDHELCHMAVFVKDQSVRPAEWKRFDPRVDTLSNCEWRYGTRGHDLEEFTEIVSRHGFWKSDVSDMAAAMPRQQRLPDVPIGAESAFEDEAVAVTNGHAHPSDHDVEDPAVTESWKATNGIGTSDIEMHRRRRGTRSSEQVGALP